MILMMVLMLTIIRMAVVGGDEVAWLIGAWKIANWPQHHIGHKRHQQCTTTLIFVILVIITKVLLFWKYQLSGMFQFSSPLTPEVSRPARKRKF